MNELPPDIELSQIQNTLRKLRPLIRHLKPHYKKIGRPTKQDKIASGNTLTRAQWESLWERYHSGWGGKRSGSGSQPKGKKTVRMDFTIDLEHAEALQKLPKGERSRYVNRALELLIMMHPPSGAKPEVPPRGRHAHKPEGWKQPRPCRMTPIEKARHNLEIIKSRLEAEKILDSEGFHPINDPV